MTTRRYFRTMQAAFGPYTDDRLHPMQDNRPVDFEDKIVIAGCIFAVLALLVLAML